ncbi:MAG: patatin-like phospholipase family protein, partial [Mycobacteriaceae bacterium]|nr:patatin-like phospholipase family protein [Mycobacteriaceae bacterium]
MPERLALVLAGGGVAGIAWETGFLLGMQDVEPAAAARLLDADLLLGTSAGSAVAAQISSGVPLTELFARQLAPNTHEIKPRIEIDDLIEIFGIAAVDEAVVEAPADDKAAADQIMTDRLRAIGQHAVAARTISEEARRSVIAHRLPSHRWPTRRLEVTAIDVETGERVLFGRDSGVSLIDAVAASCAVPGV